MLMVEVGGGGSSLEVLGSLQCAAVPLPSLVHIDHDARCAQS